ncbi:helix-turn-helix domain-containing protein [Gorillibacterium timonense]|uniref:helix-turn-helix domain-containing protein n=1 Tax=Gorillibacterium timonense TaxID=1689269 RepID=UPI00071C3A49|nr:helix-turn-helix domain-containing protein [Gorillibacterium timonense]
MIGKRVQELRMKKGLTLSELAERAGVAKSYLSTMERDIQSNPSIQFLEKIASVLNVSVESLIHPDQEAQSPKRTEDLDEEWRLLVRDAMASGISKEQFRDFLEYNKWRLNKDKDE